MNSGLMKELIQTLMQGKHSMAAVLHDRALSLSEFVTLAAIEKNAAHSERNVYADDLQRFVHISKPAISQMLKSLEKAGYIRREINPENRRKLTVILTDEGRAVYRKALGHYGRITGRIIDAFGEAKTRQLIDLYAEFTAVAMTVAREEASCHACNERPPQGGTKE